MSYTDTCDPIVMYCLGLIVVVYSKQCCLQTNKYDQSLRVTDVCILTINVISFLSYASSIWRKRRWTKLPIIAPYIYDARYRAHPYILSTTVLSNKVARVYCLRLFVAIHMFLSPPKYISVSSFIVRGPMLVYEGKSPNSYYINQVYRYNAIP